MSGDTPLSVRMMRAADLRRECDEGGRVLLGAANLWASRSAKFHAALVIARFRLTEPSGDIEGKRYAPRGVMCLRRVMMSASGMPSRDFVGMIISKPSPFWSVVLRFLTSEKRAAPQNWMTKKAAFRM
eukprot:GHVQ01012129.1.p2 GENE.GHVQ01012129.1~~GHVQ01012129.1.p2  ORF type:complete len:128 (+),score=15.77 GHVQ01012129.1:257-640(+)